MRVNTFIRQESGGDINFHSIPALLLSVSCAAKVPAHANTKRIIEICYTKMRWSSGTNVLQNLISRLLCRAGYQEFPKVFSFGQGINVKDDRKRNGLKFGDDIAFI